MNPKSVTRIAKAIKKTIRAQFVQTNGFDHHIRLDEDLSPAPNDEDIELAIAASDTIERDHVFLSADNALKISACLDAYSLLLEDLRSGSKCHLSRVELLDAERTATNLAISLRSGIAVPSDPDGPNLSEAVLKDLLDDIQPMRDPKGISVNHAAWMAKNLPDDTTKRQRWIGYAQSLAVTHRLVSLDQLRDLTRPPSGT